MIVFATCRESVHIEVRSANNAPSPQKAAPSPQSGGGESTWERDSYTLEVDEDKLYDDILQLEIEGLQGDALRRCQFYIDTPDVPFIIDNQGTSSTPPPHFLSYCTLLITKLHDPQRAVYK